LKKHEALTVLRAGFLTTVQDLGRSGLLRFGISSGGALDRHALRIANPLLGNEETAAGMEITLGGLCLSFDGPRLVAWCGGAFDVKIGGAVLPPGRVGLVQAGQELSFDHPKLGCRAWLAISPGIDVAPVLGSRATDLRGGFGGFDGRPLRSGDVVPLGVRPLNLDSDKQRQIFSWSAPAAWAMPAAPEPVLRFTRGTDWYRFGASAQQTFTNGVFTILPHSNRMGARLDGPLIWREDQGDLISEAVTPGTIQVPPNGKPILLLGDCQTIGGYPKLGHVITVDLPVAAQLCPGHHVRFQEVSLDVAHQLLIARENEVRRFSVGVSLHR
jgi:antagonist of KipI